MSARDHQSLERVTSDLLPVCSDCGDLAFPGATVCDSCGTHLTVRQGSGRPYTAEAVCDCGVCIACVLASYESDAQ